MNKVLVFVNVPLIQKRYEIYIPIGMKICKVSKLIIKAINEITDNSYKKDVVSLYSKLSGKKYEENSIVKNTDIRNSTELVLI